MHTLVWALTAPQRLGERAREMVTDARTDVIVSPASAWETSTKVRLCRFPQAETLVLGLPHALRHLGAMELSITSSHTLLAGRLPWPHRDPFDRMLAAQAMAENLVLVTKDAAFGGVPGLHTPW